MWTDLNEDAAIAWERPQVLERIRDIAEQDFSAEEDKMRPVKDVLRSELPYLSQRPFLWVEVADFYTCRSAHGDPIQSKSLRLIRSQVLDHTAWRFRQWYRYPEVLREVCGDLLGELFATCRGTQGRGLVPSASDDVSNNYQVTLVSTHDVMLMPFVHLLGGFKSLPNETKVGLYEHLWPGYAASLRVEVAESSEGVWVRPSYQQHVGGRVMHLPVLAQGRSGFYPLETMEQAILTKLGRK